MPTPLHHLIQSLDTRRCALLDELATLSAEALQARPRPEAWSILEIAEHVVAAEKVILQGLPPQAELVARPRTLKNRLAYVLVMAILRLRIPVKVPSRRMLPTGSLSLAEVQQVWNEHVRWLAYFEERPEAHRQAYFMHPVAGPITLLQALRMDRLHLEIHIRQIAKLRQQAQGSHA